MSTRGSGGAPAQKTAHLLADALRHRIVVGELGEGDSLPQESTLMAAFEVSRPTLREAFRILESEGLLEVMRGSRGGARVHMPSEDLVARYAVLVLAHRHATIVDVSTVRALLEPPCAATIARRRDSRTIAALRAAVEKAESLGHDPDAQLEAQHAYHGLLVQLAGNQTITLLHGAVQRILDSADRRRPEIASDAARHEGARAHRRLLEVIEQRDADRAEALWRRHIEATTQHQIRIGGDAKVHDLI